MTQLYGSINLMTPVDSYSHLRKIWGWLAVFGSAFFFYFATVIIKMAKEDVDIDVSYFAFCRFVLGFCVVAAIMKVKKQKVRPVNYHYLIGRMLGNTAAVYCFYQAASLGSVAEANILNMTYPLFVALASWFIFKAQRDKAAIVFVIIACLGVWLVLAPEGGIDIAISSIWGLLSGLAAAAAIVYLNLARRDHDSHTILIFLFGLGAVLMAVFFHDQMFWPNGREFFYLAVCSVVGISGQYLITFGFRFVTAVEGSVISSTRILLAALLGPILLAEPVLSLLGWGGALLIFAANVGLALRRV